MCGSSSVCQPGFLALFDHILEVDAERRSEPPRTLSEIWPHLSLAIIAGSPLATHQKAIEARAGRPIDFIETYGASEGLMAFQSELSDPALLLHLDNGLFYEFVPVDQLDEPNPRRYTVADVETDIWYAIYLTTSSGLWSYHVGDTVRFTELSPHKILVGGSHQRATRHRVREGPRHRRQGGTARG